MDPFVDQLKTLCRTFPTRSKWVFVPTHAIGRTLGDRLVLEGTDWANLRFVTPLDIALLMGAPFLVERGIDPSEEELGPALMMRLLLDLPLKGGYFRRLADHPTLAQALWATVRELRMAGVHPEALPPNVFTSPAKHAEIVALLSAYECFLDEQKRADMATVYQEAVRHADWSPIQSQDCWTELPDANWNPLQRALLDGLPGERLEPKTFELPGVSMPRRLTSPRAQRLKAVPGTNPLAFLMTPNFVVTSGAPKPEVHLFHAGGREAEIEEVFRRILATGVTLDNVEIACASDAHLALVWEKALRYTWPVTLSDVKLARFQEAAVQHIVARLRDDEGSRRMLLADEVGLGKTVVAQGVIQALLKRRRSPLTVIYLCSNAEIAEQNRTKLDPDSRKPMGRVTELAVDRPDSAADLLLYSFTPGTSLKEGTGLAWERRLLLYLFHRIHEVPVGTKPWREFFRCGAGEENWYRDTTLTALCTEFERKTSIAFQQELAAAWRLAELDQETTWIANSES